MHTMAVDEKQQHLENEHWEMMLALPRQRGGSPLFNWNYVSKRASQTWRKGKKGCLIIALIFLFFTIVNTVSVYQYFFVEDEIKYVWKANSDLKKFFKPVLSENDTADMIAILKAFAVTLEDFNIPYLMYSGTLIGSWRHLGCIPWDDDLDVMINYTDKERVRVALDTLRPKYRLYTGFIWKLYLDDDSRPYRAWWERFGRWRWPFVDIFFYQENLTHIWDTKEWLKNVDIYKKADVFPLIKRPFEDLWLYAPKDTEAVLAVNFDPSVCASSDMSHKTQASYHETKRIKCGQLDMQYPFVKRKRVEGTNVTEEILAFGNGTVVRTIYLLD